VTLPLPNPAYLAFHAAIAKVVYVTGVDRRLGAILEERENKRAVSDEAAIEHLDGLLRLGQKCPRLRVGSNEKVDAYNTKC